MKSLLTTTALTVFVGTAAFAQSVSTDTNAEAGTDLSAQVGNQAITAEGNATAQVDAEAETDLMDHANNAVTETGNALEDGAEATGNALAEAGEEVEQGVEATGNAIAEAGAEVEAGAENLFAGASSQITSPKIESGAYVSAHTETMTLADLEGTVVYDINDEEIGEISEVMLSANGAVDKAVIDVGGFIGIGEKSVAVPFSQIALMTPAVEAEANAGVEANAEVVAYVDSTQEELEALPEVE
ncbi:PRC-barrel domain-containing protein [Loktanella agnita]|uniref:PRC-barrel domain-containing protein n=1 Tax=Loktanella agnita TaxID=287097 RepID=UPI0039885171